jgi:hypothetical protein
VYGGTPDPHGARTGGRSVQTGGRPPASSSPASSRASNDRIYRGVFGLAGGFGAPGCTKVSLKPKCSRTLTSQSTRAPRHAQGPAPSGNDTSQDHHDRHPARACLRAPGARRQELPAASHADQSRIIASILSRRPEGMWSHLACGTGIPRIRAAPAGRALRADWQEPPTSPLPASSCIPNNRIYLGAFGLTGGFWVPACTKHYLKPKSSRTRVPQDARAPRHAPVPGHRSMTSPDRHDRDLPRGCLTAARSWLRSAAQIRAGSSLRS